ncbi:MAG: glucuronate isomerase [Victivallales bacterium]|nr:glucuronate isomerase [Victivallales bacterium]
MSFLDEKYLLSSEVALALYTAIKDLPVIDPHNHADVKEIAANNNYPNPWQLFAATDHYVWEILRKRNVPEEFITGNQDPKVKWMMMAEVFPEIAGNPVYEWIHLDLKRYLGIDELLGPDTGDSIWDKASEVLARPGHRPQQLLDHMKIEVMCSTDDPVDLLEDHVKVNKSMNRTLLRPTWRPDKAMNIFKPGWKEYIDTVAKRFNMTINSVGDLIEAMRQSHDYFAARGCLASDHGVEVPFGADVSEADADAAFKKALDGKSLSKAEQTAFMSYFFGEVAEFNSQKDWVFQIHIGAVRDVRDTLYNNLGPDSGGDVARPLLDVFTPLKSFLNRFDDRLKVVLYCLDTTHQHLLATMSRAFGGKVNLGSAWWLNDNPIGMKRQLEYIGSVDVLANFAGMVSDSRKLLSYGSRFEMFRRVLADALANMVNLGQIPYSVAEKLAERMSYSGPKKFWGF